VNNSDLIARGQSGDPDAVDQLLRIHYDAVYSICHRMVLSREGADDAVQNALIAIVKGLPRFHGRAALSTWVYRIATNAAIDEIRRVQRQPHTVAIHEHDTHSLALATHDSTTENIGRFNQSSQVAHALAKVPEEFRTALVLRYVADLDYAEIAVTLDVPIGTVRSRLARGKKLMGELLNIDHDEGDNDDFSPDLTRHLPAGEPNLATNALPTSPLPTSP